MLKPVLSKWKKNPDLESVGLVHLRFNLETRPHLIGKRSRLTHVSFSSPLLVFELFLSKEVKVRRDNEHKHRALICKLRFIYFVNDYIIRISSYTLLSWLSFFRGFSELCVVFHSPAWRLLSLLSKCWMQYCYFPHQKWQKQAVPMTNAIIF